MDHKAEEEAKQKAIIKSAEEKKKENWRRRFFDLTTWPTDGQGDFFLKRYIFTIGKDGRWKEVKALQEEFKSLLSPSNDEDDDEELLTKEQADQFLAKHGKTRTPEDYLVHKSGEMAFIEVLVLFYKTMILKEYFQRREKEPDIDLSGDDSSIHGYNDHMMEEVFSIPCGLDTDLEKLMVEFSIMHAKKEANIRELEAIAALGGVRGMAATTQLNGLKQQDQTDLHAVEAKIAAAMKRAHRRAEDELQKTLAAG